MRTDTGAHILSSGFSLALLLIMLLIAPCLQASRYAFTVAGDKTYLNGQRIPVKGLRCSNVLISDRTTDELIENLDTFASYGVNAISVYFMGSRFGDVKGYNEDGSLNPICAARMSRIIESADERGMIVLVGCLHWGSYSKRKGYYNYINIGLCSENMKTNQKETTAKHLRNGWGYMCASTWLQCAPPYGPNHSPGGDGSDKSPGIKWWLEYLRSKYGPYRPPVTKAAIEK